jgi:hypothetical protein
MCTPIARQRLGKQISSRGNALDNRTFVARQQRGKYASSTVQGMLPVWYVTRGYKRKQSEDAAA